MKIKTRELSGIALDWSVAKCEGWEMFNHEIFSPTWVTRLNDGCVLCHELVKDYSPSSNWSQGGPIIARERIAIYPLEDGEISSWIPFTDFSARANSPIIAAMRCYVASKLGEEVEVPDELFEEVT